MRLGVRKCIGNSSMATLVLICHDDRKHCYILTRTSSVVVYVSRVTDTFIWRMVTALIWSASASTWYWNNSVYILIFFLKSGLVFIKFGIWNHYAIDNILIKNREKNKQWSVKPPKWYTFLIFRCSILYTCRSLLEVTEKRKYVERWSLLS